ncbi:MAG TPA: hypothetical protein VFG91_05040 [Woeseiaceae bacterium]|nr:hypothetical protein [Woeseiaceae bacterium]
MRVCGAPATPGNFRYDVYGRRTWEIGPADDTGTRLASHLNYREADDKDPSRRVSERRQRSAQ